VNKRYRIILLLVLGVLLATGTTVWATDTTTEGSASNPPPQGVPTRTPPVLVISFSDAIPMHNMAIGGHPSHYYTANGGNSSSGQINTYDLNGVLQNTTPCTIDMRAIFYNSATGNLYAKGYDRNLYQVDPMTGAYSVFHAGMFAYSQSSPAVTPDGTTVLEHENGTIRVLDFATGGLTNTLSGFYFGGYPSNEAVGTDGARIFTWDGTLVQVTDMSGAPIESYNLPQGHYGFTLKFVNGLLFAADDGSGGTGTWYGYDVGGATPVENSSWGRVKSLYR